MNSCLPFSTQFYCSQSLPYLGKCLLSSIHLGAWAKKNLGTVLYPSFFFSFFHPHPVLQQVLSDFLTRCLEDSGALPPFLKPRANHHHLSFCAGETSGLPAGLFLCLHTYSSVCPSVSLSEISYHYPPIKPSSGFHCT